jgi:vWA-MoxR associated protein C-terminal domain
MVDFRCQCIEKTYAEHEYFYLNFSYLLSEYSKEIHKSISPELLTKIEQIRPNTSAQDADKDREIKYIRHLSFSKDELKELLGLFLNESLLILYYEQEEVSEKIDLSELTIEVFLPPELLCDCDLDRCSFYDMGEGINLDAVGGSYRILIRSLERSKWLQPLETGDIRSLRKNASKKKAWQDKWALVYSKCQEGAIPTDLEFPLLSHTDDFDKAILDEKIGVKLVQESGRDEILKVIIEEKGIPIVLWTRFSDLAVDFETGWQELVHTEPLHDLPQSVRMSRQAAQESGFKNHLGSNLVFLWDDPNSLPPPEGDFLRVDNSIKRSES